MSLLTDSIKNVSSGFDLIGSFLSPSFFPAACLVSACLVMFYWILDIVILICWVLDVLIFLNIILNFIFLCS